MRSFQYCTRIITTILVACSLVSSVVQPALAQVAPGTTQSAAQTATITGTVTQSNGTPVSGADVFITGQGAQQRTKTDASGAFTFTGIPFGTYLILVNSTLGDVSKANVAISGDTSITIKYAENTSGLKTIADVSTNAAGAHINASAASIASVAPRDFAFQGNTSWQHMIEQIPGVSLSGGSYGGCCGALIGVNGSPFQPLVVSINGALPYETSTVLDGMPFSNATLGNLGNKGGAADLSDLPLTAFDALDVVRGPGANSPTIVDSIGGSLVLHSPGLLKENHFEFSTYNDQYGGIAASALLEHRFSPRLSGTFGYSTWTSPGPQHNQYLLSTGDGFAPLSVNGQPFWGCGGSYGGGAFIFPPLEIDAFCGTQPLPGSALANASGCGKYAGFACFEASQVGLVYCCVFVDSSWTRHEYSAGLAYKVSPSVTAQVFYAGSSSHDKGGNGEYFVSDFEPAPPSPGSPSYVGSIAPGLFTYNAATIGAILGTNNQGASLVEERISAFLGRGVLRVAGLQNYSRYWNSTGPNIGLRNGQYAVYGTGFFCDSQVTDPFCFNPGAPVTFNGQAATLTFPQFALTSYNWSDNRDLLLSYALQLGDRSSVGASYVDSYYDNQANNTANIEFGVDVCQPGNILGFVDPNCHNLKPPKYWERTREIRIFGESQLGNKLTLGASWYIARGTFHVQNPTAGAAPPQVDRAFPYSEPRLGVTWRVDQDMVVRASAGGGFALPALSDIQSVTNQSMPDCGATNCSVTLANFSLQPEKAFSFDVGTDIRMHRNTVLSLDLYRNNLFGQFFNTFFTIPRCGDAYNNCTNPDLPLFVTQEENLVHTRYEGLVMGLSHATSHGMFWNGNIGLTRSYALDLPSNFYDVPGQTCSAAALGSCRNLTVIPNINFTGGNAASSNGSIPYANGSATIGYSWGPAKSLSVTSTYIGNNNAYYVPAFVSFDANSSVPLNENITLLASYRNFTGIHGNPNTLLEPLLGAPTAFGKPFPLYPQGYVPRNFVLTFNYNT